MIYDPFPVFNWANALETAFVRAGQELAIDFLAQSNKPWTYYVGNVLGHAAAATGIPGAAAVLYVVGDSLDYYVLKTPEGSDVRVFLNGVQAQSLSTYAATEAWELVTGLILDNNKINKIEILNDGPAAGNTSGFPWLVLGEIEVINGTAYLAGVGTMPYNTLSVRFRDSESDNREKSLPIYLPTGFTLPQYQTWTDAALPEIDALTDTVISEVELTIRLVLPGGLKPTVTNSALNERGGLISIDTSGPRNDSIWIPGIARAIMPGDSFALTGPVSAFLARMTAASTAANIRPVTKDDFNIITGLAGKKSFRK